jgi:hypothetical protein
MGGFRVSISLVQIFLKPGAMNLEFFSIPRNFWKKKSKMPVAMYSIPRSTRGGPQKTLGNGPGAYSPMKSAKSKPPSYKIGSEPKGKWAQNENPGPGNYYGPV